MEKIQDLDQILDLLAATRTLPSLQQIVEKLTEYLQVDHAVYHWVDSLGDHYHFGTYPSDWVERYQSEEYVRIDPVVTGCYQSFHPVDWRRLDWSPRKVRLFLRDALAHGIGNQGYSIPIRGPSGQFAVFTISHNCDDSDWDALISNYNRELLLLAHFFNRKALEFEPGRLDTQEISLSPREIDALTLLGQGQSRAQVAQALSISEHTLRVYIESARYKLGAANTTHAIARATSYGLIVI
ncbi:LuxR family transcriptional regulator [Epibacterium sp. SM1979]|uniref:LuxR family transcriptional regulator n=2 Tax=Tritonibacter litoralis TaxID=2662264 RepID=A0A843YJ56_9RHOB|nr:LuxR family transcriptional regulator [Tritonibacter litoralis]